MMQKNIDTLEETANKACFLDALNVDMSLSPSGALHSEAMLNVLYD